jgi:hypothetical protein
MKQLFDGRVYDTATAIHLGMVEGYCASEDKPGTVENHLYRTPDGSFFFHRIFPPLYSIEIGALEEIEPIKERYALVEWAEGHNDPSEAARAICGGAV